MIKYYIPFIVVLTLITACGPKTVGDEGSYQAGYGGYYPQDDPNELRYPFSGRNLDKNLYTLNHTQYMQSTQNALVNDLRQSYSGEDINKYTNLQPEQVSPFRQN